MVEVEGIVRKQMVLFFIVDTSGSMAGNRIEAVDTAVREVLPELKDIEGSDVDLKIACLKFSSGCEWMDSAPVSVENFKWKHLQADGVTDLGAACIELESKMHRDQFLSAPPARWPRRYFCCPTETPPTTLSAALQNSSRITGTSTLLRLPLLSVMV